MRGVKLTRNGPFISHLFYVIDTIFAGEWDYESIRNLSHILKCFQMYPDLKVNFLKSQILGVDVSNVELHEIVRIFGCLEGNFPFKYLGVPIGTNMALKNNGKPILDKVSSKLSMWKAKSLSFGGLLTLIKSLMNLRRSDKISYGAKMLRLKRRFIRWDGLKLLHQYKMVI